MDIARTLVWVAPLTLLIWVWAQDQQIEGAAQQNVPLRITHVDGERVLLRLGDDGASPVERLTLSGVTFQGPRIGLSEILLRLSDNLDPPLFDLKLDLPPVDRVAIDLRNQINNLDVLQDAGVSVVEVTPAQLYLRVEERQEIEARVVADPDTPYAVAGQVLFDPPTVTLQGPSSAIQAIQDAAASAATTSAATTSAAAPPIPTVLAELPGDAPVGESVIRDVPLRLPPDADDLTLSRSTVRATFTRAAEVPVRTTLQRVLVRESTPAAMSGQFLVEIDTTVINNVTIEGPADVVARIQRGDIGVEAHLVLDRDDQDLREPTRRRLSITLPPNVTLIGEAPEVTFEIRRPEGAL